MCQKAYSDTLPRFRVTSCLRKCATPCFLGYDLLPPNRTRPPAFPSWGHPAPPFRRPVAFRLHEKPKGEQSHDNASTEEHPENRRKDASSEGRIDQCDRGAPPPSASSWMPRQKPTRRRGQQPRRP